MLGARVRRAFQPTRADTATATAPCQRRPRPTNVSAPIATCSHALIASSARRTAPRRSRHLRDGRRSVGFIVDSGCTWHIHPHASDLVNVKPCEARVVGIDGRPQRCTVVRDLPIVAVDKSGNDVSLTLKDVRCVPSFSDSLLSVNALWEASESECRFAN
eukprot:4775759-Pleurochrysis_carterae.AAC.1